MLSRNIQEQKRGNPFNDNRYNEAFDELYTPLCQFAMRFLNDREPAEDIVQEQFIYLWENWDRLSDITSKKAYLYKAVKNRSISYLIKKSRQSISSIEDIDESCNNSKAPTPQELAEKDDLERILENALENLPKRCREIFVLKRFAEFSNKDIAEKMDISIKTVEAQTTIALKKIKGYLNKHWGELSVFIFITLNFFNI